MYYAIMVIGDGRAYSIRKVVGGWSIPVGESHRTLKAAKEKAKALGLEIAKIGDSYQIH